MSEQMPEIPLLQRATARVQIDCSGNSRTEQTHKKTQDVNNIMRKYQQTGLMPQKMSTGQYGDFTNVEDYHRAVTLVQEAYNDFMHLPAQIRKRFDNDPAKLLTFCQDASNIKEARELGILPKLPVEPIVPHVDGLESVTPPAK